MTEAAWARKQPLDAKFSEEDYIPLSALEHCAYCPRQCALIHQEQVFDEKVLTLSGAPASRPFPIHYSLFTIYCLSKTHTR